MHSFSFIAGEYGFLNTPNDYALFLSNAEREGCAGSLVWSLRPHSSQGGFKTHREDESNCAYHVPGWPSPVTPQHFSMPNHWDNKEHTVIQYIRHASYGINGEAVPQQYPQPNAPYVWTVAPGRVSWKGSAWANCYEVWLAPHANAQSHEWHCIAQGVLDAVSAGQAGFYLPQGTQGQTLLMRGVGLDGVVGEWSNAVQG